MYAIISLDEYNNIKENLYIRESSVMYDRIIESDKQIEQGDGIMSLQVIGVGVLTRSID